jgi:hypothetical protein
VHSTSGDSVKNRSRSSSASLRAVTSIIEPKIRSARPAGSRRMNARSDTYA